MGTGTGKRGLLAAALAVVCAVTVLGAPGVAFASPGTPDPGSGSSSGSRSGSNASTSTSPTAGSSTPPLPSTASDKDLEAVHIKLEALYHDAAVATDDYNAAEEAAKKQSAKIVELAKKIVAGQAKLDDLKDRAGAAARAQYRTGGLPDGVKLMLSDDPTEFLDGAGRVLQGQRATKDMIGELTRTQQDLEQYSKDASAQWQKLEAGRRTKAAAQKKIEQQIAAAEKLESRLAKKEKERLEQLEQQDAQRAQTAWLDTGILAEINSAASAQGRKAVQFATAQMGKAYEWGAEGPDTFDCSGLTSEAWKSAGQAIPRTSQEQWKQLPHVAVEDMRPGDLIIYFDDASHVALYVGDGTIIHAPRPGRTVTLAGAGSMPILGVVRPDA
ncbi:Cell wall-associated hydrolase, NlpC family [Streptomyces sp. yr375]|uniref:C40 family peptidase n=2 Tax=Streptomyces sp. yr375 TaxID=1761906 RepID=UPI0008AC7E2B|nr:NlpC/P60 family protein [Streptomyces sp. yr375]SES49982.1 Cell wall-associated hydrolase, NlpC family [Streptomyces sp. yr375]